MGFSIYDFTHIVTIVTDIVSMLDDDAKVSIATSVESIKSKKEDEDDKSSIVLNLSFPLKNGLVEMSIYDSEGFIEYYDAASKNMLKQVEFNYSSVGSMKGSFYLSLKEIIAADKQNKRTQSAQNISIGDSEMDKLRKQISGVN
jgi:hypothetical protein